MHGLREDLRYVFRTLTRDRRFTIAALVTVALGIGANTAIFSVIDHVLLRPLAYRDSGRLYSVHEYLREIAKSYPILPVNAKHFQTWRQEVSAFEQAGLFSSMPVNLTGVGAPEKLNALRVSADFLPTLGVQPAIGRGFLTAEEKSDANHVVILTGGLWRRRFGADPAILGRKILLSGVPHEIVGVLPESFRFFRNKQLDNLVGLAPTIDLLRPIGFRGDEDDMGEFNHHAIARLRPGVTEQRALAELNAVQDRIVMRSKDKAGLEARLTPLQEQVVGTARKGLLILLGAVGIVLLIVCVNLGNLMLARATARSREVAIRTALGARAGRLIRQALVECVAISLAGGILGVGIAYAGVAWVRANAPADLPRIDEVSVDWRILLFAFASSTIAGLLFGIVPAWRITKAEPVEAMRSGTRSVTESREGLGLRSWLVSAEVAMSAALLVAAGLLLHSFYRVVNSDRGFAARHLLAARLSMNGRQYEDDAKRVQFLDRLLPALRELPGVSAAGMSLRLPLEGEYWVSIVSLPNDPNPPFKRPIANYRDVDPGFFNAIGIRVLQGRTFSDSDRSHRVAVVSERFAKTVWPGQNPIGKRFSPRDEANDKTTAEIIGVVADTPASGLDQVPPLTGYIPYWDEPRNEASLVLRTIGDPRSVVGALKQAVSRVDPDMPVSQVLTMDEIVSDSVAPRRFQAFLTVLFGASALGLEAFGIYGVVAYGVARRRSELGIRLALGARGADIVRLVVSQGMLPVWLGLLIGILAALAFGRVMAGLLYGVSAYDPATIVVSGGVLVCAALLACAGPALRASRSDPLQAIRYE
jgi:putative ABC transport system permease protein